jgi:hypothetical protein
VTGDDLDLMSKKWSDIRRTAHPETIACAERKTAEMLAAIETAESGRDEPRRPVPESDPPAF